MKILKYFKISIGVAALAVLSDFTAQAQGIDQITNVVNFNNQSNPIGAFPGSYSSIIRVGNKLYGTTSQGGAYTNGVIFSVDTDGSHYKDIYDFDYGDYGSRPQGSVIYSSGKLYGMTTYGGVGYGNIYRVDTNGNGYIDMWDFDAGYDTNGSIPNGNLIISGKKLYGMTQFGGVNNYGNVFSIDTDATKYKDLWDFDDTGSVGNANGEVPFGDVILINNKLYGMTPSGGPSNSGLIFDIDTNGGGYKDMYDFSNGENPEGYLINSGYKLYGEAPFGGLYGDGYVFSIDTNGSAVTDLSDFHGSYSYPGGSLTLAGNKLYGVTTQGGQYGFGNIFNLDTNGNPFGPVDLIDFTDTTGATPMLAPLLLSRSRLYGTTNTLGANGYGTVFYYDTTFKVSIITDAPNCNSSNDGRAYAHATGGEQPYTYKWSDPSHQTRALATGLSVGVYTVYVTGLNRTVKDSAVVALTEPATVKVSASLFADIGCNGDNTGVAIAAASGGIPPYSYSWTGVGVTTATASGLSAGTYSVYVSDDCGHLTSTSITITQPTALDFSVNSTDANGSCNGSGKVNVSGGVPPYTYSWTGGGTNDTVQGKCAGSYCCTVSDAESCSKVTVCVTITGFVAGVTDISSTSGEINIYPNPNTGHFTVAGVTQGQVIMLYNYLGQELSSTLVDNITMYFNISTNPNGIYLVRILNGDGSLATEKKILKTE